MGVCLTENWFWVECHKVQYWDSNSNDTKVYSKLKRSNNDDDLQKDLEKLEKWSEKWQMLFNFDKYKCLRQGHGNPNLTYKMGNVDIGTTSKEKDLRVTLSANLNVAEQCRSS